VLQSLNEIINLPSGLFLDGKFFDRKEDIEISIHSDHSGINFEADVNQWHIDLLNTLYCELFDNSFESWIFSID
jgi:hypothetical protein